MGDEQHMHTALQGAEIVKWERSPAGFCTVVLNSANQDDVDCWVDQLRKQGVSIVGLSRERKTLEDAFLAIVAEAVE
jgi:hypothetical protein